MTFVDNSCLCEAKLESYEEVEKRRKKSTSIFRSTLKSETGGANPDLNTYIEEHKEDNKFQKLLFKYTIFEFKIIIKYCYILTCMFKIIFLN